MNYYAHSKETGEYQLLKDHLENVARLSSEYANAFGAGPLGYIAGLLHDLGKYSQEFQLRIRGNPIRVDHSTAGAQWVMKDDVIRMHLGTTKLHKHMAEFLAFAIAFHHGGLRNYGTLDEGSSLKSRLAKSELPECSQAWSEISLDKNTISLKDLPILTNLSTDNLAWKLSFFGRMLYSCLVDADTQDTREFCSSDSSEALILPGYPSIEQLLDRLSKYLGQKFQGVEDTIINRNRRLILEACEHQAQLHQGLFSLTVPTGGGKTLSSLAFALRHAVKHKLRRIIYVIPFTSIIEQNAKQFRDAIGSDGIIEHHSNFDAQEYEEHHGPDEARRFKLSTENWDAPVIVTTSVQFFESLFSNKRSKCRKLHNMAQSVIVLDEAQSIPRGYLEPCLKALEELVESYGCSVVLCTATQPSWEGLNRQVIEIMDTPSPQALLEVFKRVECKVFGTENEVTSDNEVAEWLKVSEHALCIVNTRRHAKQLLEVMGSTTEGLYHLSGRQFPKHRSIILNVIKQRLFDRLPCKLISTQLIEAGVDVDFPLVIRAYAGLDSIAQAAGRCNREGKLSKGNVIVFYPEKHGMPSKGWLKETTIEAQNTLRDSDDQQVLSPKCMTEYFERIHGIRDGRKDQLTDQQGLIPLLRQKNGNMEIPYEDIASRFSFIETEMEPIVIPILMPMNEQRQEYDNQVMTWLEELTYSDYPTTVLRKLQPYTVQVYRHELLNFAKMNLIRKVGGIWVLNDLTYYDEKAGLLSATDDPEPELFIF